MNGLVLDLYAIKGSRIGQSQTLALSLNLSSVLSISVKTDVKEMARQLDRLDDFAKKNPVQALTLLTSFVNVINIKSNTIEQVIMAMIIQITYLD